jgi:phage regulator Rha-like protein
MTITNLTVRRIRDRCFFDETIDAALAMAVFKRVGPVDDKHDLNLENAVAKLEKLARARGGLLISDIALILHIPSKEFFRLLAAEGYIYKRSARGQWLATQEHRRTGLFVGSTQVTPLGLIHFAVRLETGSLIPRRIFGQWTPLVVEPVVFERNDRVYANTRDVAASYGREHRHVVRALERAIKRRPELIRDGDVVEILYRDSGGRPAVSYDLSHTSIAMFGDVMIGRAGRRADFCTDSYLAAFRNKEQELRTEAARTAADMKNASAALAAFLDATLPPLLPRTTAGALRAAMDVDDPNTMKGLMLVVAQEATASLAKVNQLYGQINELHDRINTDSYMINHLSERITVLCRGGAKLLHFPEKDA